MSTTATSAVQTFAQSARVVTEARAEISKSVIQHLRDIRQRAANLFLESASNWLRLENRDLEAGLNYLRKEQEAVLAGADISVVIPELYRELDPEILRLRDEEFGLPRLVPVCLSERGGSISIGCSDLTVKAGRLKFKSAPPAGIVILEESESGT